MTFDWWVRAQFRLRNDYLSRAVLRPGLPRLAKPAAGELEFYRLLLSRALGGPRPEMEQVWDIGCRNWTYAPALREAFPQARLTGVELDGGRRYWSLYRRIDQAHAQAAAILPPGSAQALHEDFRRTRLPEDLSKAAFTSFYPFVSENPALGWGVPSEYSHFDELLSRVARARLIVTIHQGEWEAEIARESYARCGLPKPQEFTLRPEEFRGLWPSPHPSYGMIVEQR